MLVALFIAALIAEAFGVQRINYGYGETDAVYSTGATAAYLCWFILALAYHPTCWWAFQGTIGQRGLGLRVVRAEDGTSLGVGATTIRYLVWLVCQLITIIAIIAAAMASDNPRKQAWWDEAAGSVVVHRL
jgi:uncharacterized RDD family membrane protein YckC